MSAPEPQRASGEAHEIAHEPIEHTLPAGHTRPHMPQLSRSVCVETHFPAHTVCPVGHENLHPPAAQICPAGQAVPHAPQFDGSP